MEDNTNNASAAGASAVQINLADENTIARIRDLGTVGTALKEMSNGRNFETNIYAAKQALAKFMDGIGALKLDAPLQKGIDDLRDILEEKLQAKMQDTFDTAQQNF